MKLVRKSIRFFLVEIRDWVFAIIGIICATVIPMQLGNWWLAIPVLVVVVVLYILTIFLTSRLLGKDKEID